MKNVKQLLVQGAQYPAAIEARLPEGAPVVSTMLLDTATQIPVVPDFPVEIPDLPSPPEITGVPGLGRGAGEVKAVTGASVTTLKPLGKEILS